MPLILQRSRNTQSSSPVSTDSLDHEPNSDELERLSSERFWTDTTSDSHQTRMQPEVTFSSILRDEERARLVENVWRAVHTPTRTLSVIEEGEDIKISTSPQLSISKSDSSLSSDSYGSTVHTFDGDSSTETKKQNSPINLPVLLEYGRRNGGLVVVREIPMQEYLEELSQQDPNSRVRFSW
jgi:hypothetical protein